LRRSTIILQDDGLGYIYSVSIFDFISYLLIYQSIYLSIMKYESSFLDATEQPSMAIVKQRSRNLGMSNVLGQAEDASSPVATP
jgi:hypothetical protein